MRIVLLTQSDPFYLAKNISFLVTNLPSEHKIVGCVLFDVSPFGKKENFLSKAKKTYSIFGLSFFCHYSFEYVKNIFDPTTKVENVLQDLQVPILKLRNSVNSTESLREIIALDPELLVSIAGNQIFKPPLINLAPKGCLNLHSSLLPKYRGLMPSFWVMKNQETETGVSVFFVDEGIDSGPILVQKKIAITPTMTHRDLILKTKEKGMIAIIEAIKKIEKGNQNPIANRDSLKSYFSFPTRKDVKNFLKIGKKFY
jgi:methionyl-tRNA formyltransferase